MTTLTLLVDLRRRGLTLAPAGHGDRVAPKSALTPELRETVRIHKTDLLAALSVEARLMQLSLSRFEREGRTIEIKVAGLDKTIWFVPGEADIERLAQREIPRGRIWTAKELRALWGGGPGAREQAIPLARIKLALDGEVVSVEDLRDSEPLEGSSE